MTPSQMQKAAFTIQSFVADLYPKLTPPFKTKFNPSVKYSTLQHHHTLIPHHLCLWLKITQLCLTICNPMDCSPPDSSVHGILQARILEWVAIPFSRICLYIFSKYLFGHKVPSGFSIRWYEKTQNFWPTQYNISEEVNGNPLQYSCLEHPWTEEPGGLQSVEVQRVGHNWVTNTHTHTHTHTHNIYIHIHTYVHIYIYIYIYIYLSVDPLTSPGSFRVMT